jgi:hypothetical protein
MIKAELRWKCLRFSSCNMAYKTNFRIRFVMHVTDLQSIYIRTWWDLACDHVRCSIKRKIGKRTGFVLPYRYVHMVQCNA